MMNWLKTEKRKKEERIRNEERTKKWQEYLSESGILKKIEEVKSEIEKETDLKLEGPTSDEALFQLGEKYVKKDVEKARLYFRHIIDSFPKSFYAQRAKLAIADSYFRKGDEGNMILAASEYREFTSLYPLSPRAPYAQYQIALTFWKKTYKAGRDQTKTRQALLEFQKVVTTYPLSDEAKLAQEKIKETEEKLAQHEVDIGQHYYRVSALIAAERRLTEILTNYPNYSKMDAVYFYLADTYFKWQRFDDSLPFFSKLISDYPKSKFVKNAQKKIEEINKKKAAQQKK